MTSEIRRVELASDGLVWRDGFGRVVASITAVAGTGEIEPTVKGDVPPARSPEATRHLSKILSEVARNAEIAARFDDAEPLVPRWSASAPPDTIAPMG